MGKGRDTTGTVLTFVAAGLIGAAIGLLFAPQTGKKTRRELRKFGNRVASRAEEFQEDLQDRLEDLTGDFLKTSGRGWEKGRDATQKVGRELIQVLDSGRQIISQQIDRVERLLRR